MLLLQQVLYWCCYYCSRLCCQVCWFGWLAATLVAVYNNLGAVWGLPEKFEGLIPVPSAPWMNIRKWVHNIVHKLFGIFCQFTAYAPYMQAQSWGHDVIVCLLIVLCCSYLHSRIMFLSYQIQSQNTLCCSWTLGMLLSAQCLRRLMKYLSVM